MAAGFLGSFDRRLEVHSAGTYPAARVHPKAIQVMKESGIDIGRALPKSVEGCLNQTFDYVITVCDDANEACPAFSGNVRRRLHMGFEDPSLSPGTDEQMLAEFRRVRDQIRTRFEALYRAAMLPELNGH